MTELMTEPTYMPSKGEVDPHRHIPIVYWYEQLMCPAESEWGKHSGTLRQTLRTIRTLRQTLRTIRIRIRETLQHDINDEGIWYTRVTKA